LPTDHPLPNLCIDLFLKPLRTFFLSELNDFAIEFSLLGNAFISLLRWGREIEHTAIRGGPFGSPQPDFLRLNCFTSGYNGARINFAMEVRDCNPKACRRHCRALSFLGVRSYLCNTLWPLDGVLAVALQDTECDAGQFVGHRNDCFIHACLVFELDSPNPVIVLAIFLCM